MLKELIYQKIRTSLESLKVDDFEVILDHPTNPIFGDYTTNIALQIAKKVGKNPRELAQEIAKTLTPDKVIEKVEVAGPGFINIWLTKKVLLAELQKKMSPKTNESSKKILLEFGQPNTHKLPHIGHFFSYIYGESMARIFEYLGSTVYRANYQGDIGLHVAKCLSQVDKKTWNDVKKKSLEQQVSYLQECYQQGSQAYEKNAEVKKKIQDINKKIYEHDSSISSLWQDTRTASIEYLKQLEKKLNITYDRYFYETETGPLGKELVEEHIGEIFDKSDGAIIFRGEKYGLHTRVFINSQGLATYEAKDIGLYSLKKSEFDFDESIVAIASEQVEYQKVVIKAAELVFPELKHKLKHIGFGMINLTNGKMSSRTGMILDAVSLINAVHDQIKKTFSLEDKSLIGAVTFSAIKYSFLKSDAFGNITFDIEKSVSREGDSGPYLLYTYVRCQSVLSKSSKTLPISETSSLTDEENILLRLLFRLPEVVSKSAQSYSPHIIASFLFDIAQRYNIFYQNHPILKSSDAEKGFRLLLTEKVAEVLKNGLYLLGIETVEKM